MWLFDVLECLVFDQDILCGTNRSVLHLNHIKSWIKIKNSDIINSTLSQSGLAIYFFTLPRKLPFSERLHAILSPGHVSPVVFPIVGEGIVDGVTAGHRDTDSYLGLAPVLTPENIIFRKFKLYFIPFYLVKATCNISRLCPGGWGCGWPWDQLIQLIHGSWCSH